MGKSSSINLLISVMKGRAVPVATVMDESQDHTTVTFGRYLLSSCVALLDTWGWSIEANYLKDEYRAMLRGALRIGHKMGESLLETRREQDLAVDAMLFVIDASMDDDDRIERTVQQMKDFLLQARDQRRVGTISFVLTKVDKIPELDGIVFEKDVCIAATRIDKNKRVKEVIEIIKRNLPEDMRTRVSFSKVINLEVGDTRITPVIEGLAKNLLLQLFDPILQPEVMDADGGFGMATTGGTTMWRTPNFFYKEATRDVKGMLE